MSVQRKRQEINQAIAPTKPLVHRPTKNRPISPRSRYWKGSYNVYSRNAVAGIIPIILFIISPLVNMKIL